MLRVSERAKMGNNAITMEALQNRPYLERDNFLAKDMRAGKQDIKTLWIYKLEFEEATKIPSSWVDTHTL